MSINVINFMTLPETSNGATKMKDYMTISQTQGRRTNKKHPFLQLLSPTKDFFNYHNISKFASGVFTSVLVVGMALALSACDRSEKKDEATQAQSQQTKLGIVNFPISCNAQAQKAFNTGLGHLHHMMYGQARPHFEAAAKADPDCAMAYWGIAMTHFQPLWHPTHEKDMEQGKAAVKKAKAIGASTDREKAYITAVDAFFTDPTPAIKSRAKDHEARVKAWTKASKKLHEAHPDDVDAAAFYALGEVSYATTQFSPDKTQDYSRQKRAGSLMEQYLKDYPEHPGLHHYIIHAYDSSALANKALDVARKYDKLAPESAHALHMPSHIFVRLGYWQDTVDWNKRSADAALRIINDDPHASGHYAHALDYMMYAYLQQGNIEKARETLEKIQKVQKMWPSGVTAYNIAAPQARFYLEQQKWEDAAQLEPKQPDVLPWEDYPSGLALFYYARGIGAARSGNLEQAKTERDRIMELVQSMRKSGNLYWANMTEALGQAVSAWILYEQGDTEDALKRMNKAAELEESMDKHPTSPGEVLPVRELYGDMLLKEKRPEEARQAYEKSLKRTPKRRYAQDGIERAKNQR